MEYNGLGLPCGHPAFVSGLHSSVMHSIDTVQLACARQPYSRGARGCARLKTEVRVKKAR